MTTQRLRRFLPFVFCQRNAYQSVTSLVLLLLMGISNNTRLPLGSESLKHVNQKAGGVGHGSDGLFRCREALRRSGCQE